MKQASYIIVANAGSSSYKYALYKNAKELCSAHFQKQGDGFSYAFVSARTSLEDSCSRKTFERSEQAFVSLALAHGLLPTIADISAVGFRVVHGGDTFSNSTFITPRVLRSIKASIMLAPLHNQIAYDHICSWRKLLRRTPFVAMFDTAFHRTIPEYIAAPALPKKLRERYHLHKFGFHGISCQSILAKLKKYIGYIPPRVIICHLGSGSSITAVRHGKSFDTSMGFTPLTGLPMSTRSGDIGGDIILFLQKQLGMTSHSVEQLLNKESGLLGLSGISQDMRVLRAERAKGHAGATLAIQSFEYHVIHYIGGYITALGGADAIVFTAGIGEGSWELREEMCAGLAYHGIILDSRANKACKDMISAKRSKIPVYVLATNEMEMIAVETRKLLKK